MKTTVTILGIESSCDDTAAAVFKNETMLSNIVAGQEVHKAYGGVVPELASRAHEKNIIPVVDAALKKANVTLADLDAIAFTRGPGLIGSLLIGTSFAKSLGLALDIPLIEVNHMQGHVLAHFIRPSLTLPEGEGTSRVPKFPFLCLTVSGGHTQIVKVENHSTMKVIGETVDDAAGEAFDKAAKILGLPYPGGPLVDKYAQLGNPNAFEFPHPVMPELNYSFSGIKTAILYFVQNKTKEDTDFVTKNLNDICASIQKTIIDVLLKKLIQAAKENNIKEIAIAGGVSANSGLRKALQQTAEKLNWNIYIPAFEYCTDNAAMIAIAGYYKYLKGEFVGQDAVPVARYEIGKQQTKYK